MATQRLLQAPDGATQVGARGDHGQDAPLQTTRIEFDLYTRGTLVFASCATHGPIGRVFPLRSLVRCAACERARREA